MNAIFFVLLTGCQWKAMPKQFGSGSAIHAYFQEWVRNGQRFDRWLESEQVRRVLPQSPLGKAVGYMRNQSTALQRHLTDTASLLVG